MDSFLLILKRPAFGGVSEFRIPHRRREARRGRAARWMERVGCSRARACARLQISNLKAELPELGLVISTRKQALDVPFAGTRVDLLPLGDEQQMAIARAMRGEAGERLVDQLARTAGIREIGNDPALPDGAVIAARGRTLPNDEGRSATTVCRRAGTGSQSCGWRSGPPPVVFTRTTSTDSCRFRDSNGKHLYR